MDFKIEFQIYVHHQRHVVQTLNVHASIIKRFAPAYHHLSEIQQKDAVIPKLNVLKLVTVYLDKFALQDCAKDHVERNI